MRGWEWFNPEVKEGKRKRVYRMIRIDRETVDRIRRHSLPDAPPG